ncbi:PH domain-containing protein [Corynebacterium sp. TAE3-ERU12]|uniref:PH domain-containing protein n=1 Tax=Corynebacterium sp. TAE3-ERU12 TaxID=2849491 RepID=UPI001C47358E|nr:PH domain-containing protein [Corynebacterium sp. TAE3-ERU12]MBV7295403.1 PH domain-containing protein [Corynebacterium sp. TAE3-ERU12]
MSEPHAGSDIDTPAIRSALDGDWELVVTSKTMNRWAWGAAAAIMVLHIFMGVVVNIGDTGVVLTPVDLTAFPLVGLVFAGAALMLKRARVRVNSRGVEVRNYLSGHFYVWDDIYGLSFPKTARWARLELPDFEFVPMWAIQAGDGEAAVQAVHRFRELEDRYMPED